MRPDTAPLGRMVSQDMSEAIDEPLLVMMGYETYHRI